MIYSNRAARYNRGYPMRSGGFRGQYTTGPAGRFRQGYDVSNPPTTGITR